MAHSEAPQSGAACKLTGREEALLVATACLRTLFGRARWILELPCGEMVRLTEHESLARETVRRRFSENSLKPWRKDMGCIPKVDAAYVAAMEDVLDLYNGTLDPNHPAVCFDESPVQLIGETRIPVPARPGQHRRFDHGYRRNGTANLVAFFDAHQGSRTVKVTERRAATDCAACMPGLSDIHVPEADRIRVVLDNLSTHSSAALYTALPAGEARRILRRIEFHYTPKHVSWLNMVENADNRGSAAPVSQWPHPGPGNARSRDRGVRDVEERKPGTHQLAVHDRKGPGQVSEKPIPNPMLPNHRSKSRNLCDKSLVTSGQFCGQLG